MPLPTNPPAGPASLSQNARTVLEKRYLVKDQTGAPTETAGGDVLEGGDDRSRRGPAVWCERRGGANGERGFLPPHDRAPVRAQLADTHERGPAVGAIERVFRPAGRRCARERQGRDLRHAQVDGDHPSEWRRHRFRVLAHPAQGVDGAVDDGGGVRSRVVHAALRRVHGCGEAGRHAPWRQHGDPAGRSPEHSRVHHVQGRHHQDHEFQHLGCGDRRVHGGRQGRHDVRAQGSAEWHGGR